MPTSTQAAPAANAQGTLRRILLQGRYETMGMISNGEQLVVAVVLPLMALLGLVFTDLLKDVAAKPIDAAAPGVLALCVVSTAFTGQGIATGFDRRYGVLRFLSTTPLGRAGLIYGKVMAVLVVLFLQVVVIGGTALLLGGRPAPAGIGWAIALLVLGAAAFTALGDSLRAALITGTGSVSGILILLAWTIIVGFAATRWFKWN